MDKLGFGFLRLPKDAAGEYDWKLISDMADYAISNGCDYFDTCYTYLDGNSELAIKKCLSERLPRESFRLAEKLPGYRCSSYEDCQKYFAEELERCGVEFFDVFMLHWLNAKHYSIAEETGQFRFLEEMKQKGLVRRTGFSYHDSASLLDKILDAHPEIDVVQLQINYLDWDSSGIESGKCYECCVKHGKKVIVMEPVKGGTLAKLPEEAEALLKSIHPDWSPAAWALRFVQSLPGVEICLSGMNSMDQLIDNTKDFEPLTEDEIDALRKVRDIIESNTAVPCTGCRYCVSHCPMNIPIPDYFKMYNEIKRYPDDGWKIQPSYEQLAGLTTKASACIGCGSCEQNCPQHIAIPELMRNVAETMENN